ncbi:PadR family transcriptional regulator [Nocardioides sp. cx-169]|uniref:PadR family transcriptional regulator n=1 Tax=Nocardioides sp. cx-169 TaxID=2899080 RepID=UPI001E4E83C9|nr:PadR family transcriptional regulator [Nocardioides sp. cx-169]MCD4534177.1 PadR family transcriptional regulator [Nocardioides sp. cx-169]
MSIPHGLLALLRQGPMYGYQLRAEFEQATGSTWPLNIGQVYSTLTRLERDGLVEPQATDQEGRQRYALTSAGMRTLTEWFVKPVTHADRPRDELAIKMALASTTPGLDVRAVVQTQRVATMRRLQDLTRLKQQQEPDDAGALAWSLVLDRLRFSAEAELRWLDHCEGALLKAGAAPVRRTSPTTVAEAAEETVR